MNFTCRHIAIVTLLFCSIQVSFAQNKEDIRDYWIDKYLSVSFPLRSMHINSLYGRRTDPITGRPKDHCGLDLKAHYEEVLAMFDGHILDTGRNRGSGNYITAKYGKYTVSYCHLSQIWVRPGDLIFAGDPLGISGSTGRSTGPHLHITCRLSGRLTDPLKLLLYIKGVKSKAVAALHLDENKILSPSEFIKRYSAAAMRQQQKYGIPASVILAQMAYESAWGNSNLAQAGCNYFGIKCSRQWLEQGLPFSLHSDDRPNEKFCNFSSPEASIEYHSRLLMGKKYWRCWKYSPTDFHNWLVAIKASGYATAKDYVRKCEQIIYKHKLYLYDQVAEKM